MLFILPVNYWRFMLVQTHPLAAALSSQLLASLCQSNFLSQRFNVESMFEISSFSYAVRVLWVRLCDVRLKWISVSCISLLRVCILLSFLVDNSAAICYLSPHFSHFLLVFHSHLLSAIIQHTGLCVNCAGLNIPPIWLPPHSWASLSTS